MERLVLVHGSVAGAAATWSTQMPLAERFELLMVERPGFPPKPPVDRVDFETDAALVAGLIEPGDHLVGHSYGGVISLLAAGLRSEDLRTLTVIEPPATGVALDVPAVRELAERGAALFASGQGGDPETFLRRFLSTVGSNTDLPSPLPPELEQGARALMVERGSWEAEIPLDTLADAEFSKLVVSGGHHPAFDAICDALEAALDAERVILAGYGHSVPRHPQFNERLADFVQRAAKTTR